MLDVPERHDAIGAYDYPVYHDNFQQFQQAAAVGGFVQGNSGYPPSSVASYTRPSGFTQPNPQASRILTKDKWEPSVGIKGEVDHASTPLGYFTKLTNIPNTRNECKGLPPECVVLDGPIPPMPPLYVNRTMRGLRKTRVMKRKVENDKVQIQKFWEMFKKIHVNITLADALILMPKYQKMLKSLLSNKEKLNEMANTPVSENCSAIILKKLPDKLGGPRTVSHPVYF
ncbi:hypothetical protein Tco_1392119 [Tanacetum coccineum]